MDKLQIGALLAIIGGVLIVIGALGPWVAIDASFIGTTSIKGIDGDGIITLFFGIAIAVLGGLALKFEHKAVAIATLVTSGIVFLVAAYDLAGAAASIPDVIKNAVNFGWGLYLTVLAAIIAVIGGVLLTMNVFGSGARKVRMK